MKIGNIDISKMCLGSTQVNKAYLGSTIVYQNSPLPFDSQIEYLESAGTQYIDTGIVLTQRNYELEIDMAWSGATETLFETFCGFMIGSPYSTPRCGLHKYQSQWMFGTNETASASVFVDLNRHTFIIKSYETGTEELYKDGSIIKSGTNSASGLPTNTIPFYLFARNRVTSVDNQAYCKIYSFKFTTYTDNAHTQIGSEYEFIPVRVGQVGYMYDRVSNTLFGNAGTGNFILGNDVN